MSSVTNCFARRLLRKVWMFVVTVPFLRVIASRVIPDFLAAKIFSAIILPNNPVPGQSAVLWLRRSQFEKDVYSMIERGTKFSWYELPQSAIGQYQCAWLSEEAVGQSRYVLHLEKNKEGWRRSARLARMILENLMKRCPLVAVLSAHYDYGHDEGFRMALRELQIPFLVLCRECATTKSHIKMHSDRHTGFPSTATAIAVLGPHMREALLIAKATDPERICLTGAPRWDWCRDAVNRMPYEETRVVLLITAWTMIESGVFATLIEMLGRLSKIYSARGFRFIVKPKNTLELKLFQKEYACLKEHPDLEMEVDTPLWELMSRSRCIIGAVSAGTLEALLTKAPILIPFWREEDRDSENANLHPETIEPECGVDFPTIPDMMLRRIQDYLDSTSTSISMEARLREFRRYYFFPEERSSTECVEAFIAYWVSRERQAAERIDPAT